MTQSVLTYRAGDLNPISETVDTVSFRNGSTPSSIIQLVLFVGFGVLSCGVGAWFLTDDVLPWFGGVAFLLIGLASFLAVVWAVSHRVTIDADGVHQSSLIGRKDAPWPSSRDSFGVRSARAGVGPYQTTCFITTQEGSRIWLPGIVFSGFDRAASEQEGRREMSRIWDWGRRKGYTA